MRTDSDQGAAFLAALDRVRLSQRPTLDRTAMVMRLTFDAESKLDAKAEKKRR